MVLGVARCCVVLGVAWCCVVLGVGWCWVLHGVAWCCVSDEVGCCMVLRGVDIGQTALGQSSTKKQHIHTLSGFQGSPRVCCFLSMLWNCANIHSGVPCCGCNMPSAHLLASWRKGETKAVGPFGDNSQQPLAQQILIGLLAQHVPHPILHSAFEIRVRV